MCFTERVFAMHDIERMKFNTAVAGLMSLINDYSGKGSITKAEFKTFLLLLNPFAPHMTEELWQMAGLEGLCSIAAWPQYDEAKTVDNTVEIAVQVNGKLKATIMLPMNCPKDDAIAAAKANERVAVAIAGKTVVKEISVPNKIVNIVVK